MMNQQRLSLKIWGNTKEEITVKTGRVFLMKYQNEGKKLFFIKKRIEYKKPTTIETKYNKMVIKL